MKKYITFDSSVSILKRFVNEITIIEITNTPHIQAKNATFLPGIVLG
jgi:hypothetical protein